MIDEERMIEAVNMRDNAYLAMGFSNGASLAAIAVLIADLSDFNMLIACVALSIMASVAFFAGRYYIAVSSRRLLEYAAEE